MTPGPVLDLRLTCPPENWSRCNVSNLGRRKGGEMPRKKYAPEQVINKLREAEVAISGGSTVAEASRQSHGIAAKLRQPGEVFRI